MPRYGVCDSCSSYAARRVPTFSGSNCSSLNRGLFARADTGVCPYSWVRGSPPFGGDCGLQSSHRCGCGPTKGSESLIRDGGAGGGFLNRGLFARADTGVCPYSWVRGSPPFGGDCGLQSSHRCGCGPTKGSESLILSPLSLRKRQSRARDGGAGGGFLNRAKRFAPQALSSFNHKESEAVGDAALVDGAQLIESLGHLAYVGILATIGE